MQQLISENFKENQEVALLEIGSWAGGSVLTWADIFKKKSIKYKIFCIDHWANYIDNQGSLWTHKAMKKALKENKI